MKPGARIALFAAALGLAFGAAALVGAAVDPLRDSGDAAHGHGAGHGAAAVHRLEPEATILPRGRAAELAFRVIGPDGAPVTDFDVEHERRMHLLVVRRDMAGFQHLHPRMGVDGRWSVRLRLPAAGAYRAYADFATGGRSMTLATDLAVPGSFAPRPLPAPSPAASTGRYDVALAADGLAPGADARLTYDVSRAGRPVDDLQPYLGADGHLVALREGDLAFLHVHPTTSAAPGRIAFAAVLPSAGRYRLFLQFRHEGVVRTVAHTLTVPG